MRFRKLRIAWSVVWGVAAVLLIVLWVRSYSWRDLHLWRGFGTHTIGFDTCHGGLVVVDRSDGYRPDHSTYKIEWNVSRTLRDNAFPATIAGFGLHTDQSKIMVLIPDWFLVFACVGFAALPWLRHFTYRFSLRTMLIATTLIALVLGLIVWLHKE